jgi:HK97 family phage major capsid protein
MTTGGANAGAEWIPTDFSRQLEDVVNLERMLATAIPKLPMTSSPFQIPVKKSRATAKKATEGSAPTATTTATTSVTFTATKMISYVPVSYELNEDAAVDLLPVVRADIAESLAYAEEQCILEGDTTSPHQDVDVTDAEDTRKCFKGLRKHALANGWTVDLGTFTAETIASMRSKAGVYGVRPNKLMWVAGPKVLSALLTLKDSNSNNVVISMEKLGQQATMISGQMGLLFGSPLVPAQAARENLNASGVYDGTTTDNGCLYLVYLPGWKLGERGGITAEMDRIVKSQTIDLVASKRIDFQPVHAIASEPTVVLGYNVAV